MVMIMKHIGQASRIAALNDSLRRTLLGGRVTITAGIAALGPECQSGIVRAVARFDSFDNNNDPHEEHDFGAMEVAGNSLFFKIDYFDHTLTCHSPDPTDPAVTTRILTIMLASEY